MENKIECYVFGGGLGYKPARVVGETKTTISVAFKTFSGEEKKFTFQKRKIYGQDKYEDPRADLGQNQHWFIPSITLRGDASDSRGSFQLTFAVERVQERIELDKKDRRATALSKAETETQKILSTLVAAGFTESDMVVIETKKLLEILIGLVAS